MKYTALAATLLLSSIATITSHAEEVKVEITGNDQMQYSNKALEAKVGDKLAITFKHIGKLPKEAMGHNMVILKPGTVIPSFAMKAMTAKATDYIPADAESAALILAHTKLVGPGESASVTFDAKEAGVYPFVCTFPGHFGVMSGTITVK